DYTASANFAGDTNHTPSSDSKDFSIAAVTPAFSNLSAPPPITAGTASTTLGGRIAAGALIPPGSVTISAGSASTTATIAGDGSFSAALNTSGLAAGSYTITYDYAGSTNISGAHDASRTLTVNPVTNGGCTFGGFQAPLQNGLSYGLGRAIPIKFQVTCDGNVVTDTSKVTSITATTTGPT